jgi:hypothetical protein
MKHYLMFALLPKHNISSCLKFHSTYVTCAPNIYYMPNTYHSELRHYLAVRFVDGSTLFIIT